jgi:glycosyltransferase involved in cell wall biosynthesis
LSRLAFVSPLPPAATGIADYTAEVIELLAADHEIQVFHGQPEVDRARLPAGIGIHPASELLAAQRRQSFELAVYQLGNGPDHAFMNDLLPRVPGLLVLHDLVLHHSRARLYLESPAALAYAADPSNAALRDAAEPALAAYADEVAYCYPEQAGRLDAAHLATVGTLLPYAYPLFRVPVAASRLTAVHNRFMAEAVAAELPGSPVARIAMPVQPTAVPQASIGALRERLGISPAEFVVGCFGLLSREKRVETVARAVARAAPHLPGLRLLLVGAVPDLAGLHTLLERLGVAERTILTGRVAFEELAPHMHAADLAVHLRYPTARETSAALLRLLGEGRPTVMSDLEHWDEIPLGAVVRADLGDEEGAVTRAILRLAARADERQALGARARAFVGECHAPELCRRDYRDAIQRAMAAPEPVLRVGIRT